MLLDCLQLGHSTIGNHVGKLNNCVRSTSCYNTVFLYWWYSVGQVYLFVMLEKIFVYTRII